MNTINFRITGTAPLLMHSDRGVNPLEPDAILHHEITSKKKKTMQDYVDMAWSDYKLGIYFDETLGPYIPAQNIDKTMVEGAQKNKLGKLFKSSVSVTDTQIALNYVGPRTIEGLYKDGKFTDARSVKIGQSRIIRYRPLFREWSLDFTIAFDAGVVNRKDVITALETAGQMLGLGDYRPRYGRFTVEVL